MGRVRTADRFGLGTMLVWLKGGPQCGPYKTSDPPIFRGMGILPMFAVPRSKLPKRSVLCRFVEKSPQLCPIPIPFAHRGYTTHHAG